jgi:hypothetical protein
MGRRGRKLMDLTGRVFSRLTVVRLSHKDRHGYTHWLCRCECGNEKTILGASLRSGATKSCRCWNQEAGAQRVKHGCARSGQTTAEHRAWVEMRQRCSNPRRVGWKYYGGRGIRVCWRWLSLDGFQNFLEDMGPRPSPEHSLDRIDNDSHYEPGNVRWATKTEQSKNRRKFTRTRRVPGVRPDESLPIAA